MRAILLALGFALSIFPFSVCAADKGGVSFWIDSRDPVLADWLSVRLKAHGFGQRIAHCAEVVVQAERTVVSTDEGYLLMFRVDFLSMDGTPLGRWASDPNLGFVREDRALTYSRLLERLTGEHSYFMEIAEGVASWAHHYNRNTNPSRRCGSG